MRARAAATISLSGPLALQGRQAARGLELGASVDQIELEIMDDAGRTATASDVYQNWLSAGTDLLLSPYGSNLVRRVGPITSRGGGLALESRRFRRRPDSPSGGTSLGSSLYLLLRGGRPHPPAWGLERVVIAGGSGRFAAAVTAGARERSAELGLAFRAVDLSQWSVDRSMEDTALLIVGTFTDDLALVKQVLTGSRPGLVGCVAAGLLEFGDRLGPVSEGIVGPASGSPNRPPPRSARSRLTSGFATSKPTGSHPVMWRFRRPLLGFSPPKRTDESTTTTR